MSPQTKQPANQSSPIVKTLIRITTNNPTIEPYWALKLIRDQHPNHVIDPQNGICIFEDRTCIWAANPHFYGLDVFQAPDPIQ